jgi:hypothetical protein
VNQLSAHLIQHRLSFYRSIELPDFDPASAFCRLIELPDFDPASTFFSLIELLDLIQHQLSSI